MPGSSVTPQVLYYTLVASLVSQLLYNPLKCIITAVKLSYYSSVLLFDVQLLFEEMQY